MATSMVSSSRTAMSSGKPPDTSIVMVYVLPWRSRDATRRATRLVCSTWLTTRLFRERVPLRGILRLLHHHGGLDGPRLVQLAGLAFPGLAVLRGVLQPGVHHHHPQLARGLAHGRGAL